MQRLWELDQQVFRTIHIDWHQNWLDPVFWALSYSGLGQIQVLATLMLLRWKSTRAWVGPLLVTILVSGLALSGLLKRWVDRQRPSNLADALPQEDFYFRSFPSGHTTTAFAVAFMLVLLTNRTRWNWVGHLAVAWALLVGISRIYRGVHWPTDVLGGACVGLLGACLVYLAFGAFGWLPETSEPEGAEAPPA